MVEDDSYSDKEKMLTMIGFLFKNYELEQRNIIKLIDILINNLTEHLLKYILYETDILSEVI